ncbi:response regulator transcription factor [Amnibacterium sp.]|uniref:response regulator transcription factor n=1 Tax=Amnibacterium sp. TaxID=1872496 RepID=UPI003F7C5315
MTAVLLVEDDDDVRMTTALLLRRHGFVVLAAADATAALEAVDGAAVDVVVADVGLPEVDGIALTRLIRLRSDVPVLLLTARDLPADIVRGLEAGADDYVTKPFDGGVLAARLRALERRRGTRTPAVTRIGDIEVNRSARTLSRGDRTIVVSPTEFKLLEALLDAEGATLSRRQALRSVWGDEDWIDERVVDTNVLRLRAKLGDGAIETVRGFGYRIPRTP